MNGKYAICLCADGQHAARSRWEDQQVRAADAMTLKKNLIGTYPTAHVVALMATALP